MNKSQWTRPSSHKRRNKTKKRKRDLKEPKVRKQEVETEDDGMLTKYLADEQFQLLTAKPKELLEDFIPPQWAYSFNACRTQFIRFWEERPWYDDASPDFDFFPNPTVSSDDSDGFDEESNAVLRGDADLETQLDLEKTRDSTSMLKPSDGTHQGSETQSLESDEEATKEVEVEPAPDVGEGWTLIKTWRMRGVTKGRVDRTWCSPCGKPFRSIAHVKRFKAGQARERRKSSRPAKKTDPPREPIKETISKPTSSPPRRSTEARSEPIKKNISMPISKPIDIERNDSELGTELMTVDSETPAGRTERDSDELCKNVEIVRDIDSARSVKDKAEVTIDDLPNEVEVADKDVDAALSSQLITIKDLKKKTEALYAAAAPQHNGLLSKSTMIKQVAHLEKVCNKPNLEEALPQLFLHTTAAAENRPSLSASQIPSRSPVPTYVVERKGSTMQVAARVAYLMRHYKRSNSLSRPKALFYCLKATYAKTMCMMLRKSGVNAHIHSRSSIANFAGDSIDVICVGNDGTCYIYLSFRCVHD